MGHFHHFGAQPGFREFVEGGHHGVRDARVAILKIPFANTNPEIAEIGLCQAVPEPARVFAHKRINGAKPDHEIIDAFRQRTGGIERFNQRDNAVRRPATRGRPESGIAGHGCGHAHGTCRVRTDRQQGRALVQADAGPGA